MDYPSLMEVLRTYGHDNIGYPSESTVKAIYEASPDIDEHLHTLLNTAFVSAKEPLYHRLTDNPREYIPVPETYVPQLQSMFMSSRYNKTHSVADTKRLLESNGYKVSGNGQLVNIWNRAERKLKLKPEKPKKKPLSPNTEKQRAAAKKSMKVINDRRAVEKAQRELDKARRRVHKNNAAARKTYKDLEAEEASESKTNEATEAAKERIAEGKVLYKPTEKQQEFHAASEDIVLYGGAAGGGKSYAIMMDATRYVHIDEYRALIIRLSTKALSELISVSKRIYPKAFPGAKFNESKLTWFFPSGATIQFGYLDKPDDIDQYTGLPFTYIAFDEVQHQRSDAGFKFLQSRLRSAHPELKHNCYIRASANPGGAPWVKETFIDPAPPNTPFVVDGISYRFIPARLEDNPYLDAPEEDGTVSPYRKMLLGMDETKRKQLLEGDWTASDDAMFAFHPSVHVVDELPPPGWSTVQALDYGLNDPAATLWGAVCPSTGTIVVYQEHEVVGATHDEWAIAIKEAEGYIPQGVDRVIDSSLFRNTGHIGPTPLEILNRYGIHTRPADRSRENGWVQINERLRVNPHTGKPTLLIHNSCVKLIEQLQTARRDEKKPDDIDQKRLKSKGRVHHWDLLDTLRYLCMARPQHNTIQERSQAYKQQGWDKFYENFM